MLVRTDMEGGHFRPAEPAKRAEGRALELGFVLCELLEATREERRRGEARREEEAR